MGDYFLNSPIPILICIDQLILALNFYFPIFVKSVIKFLLEAGNHNEEGGLGRGKLRLCFY